MSYVMRQGRIVDRKTYMPRHAFCVIGDNSAFVYMSGTLSHSSCHLLPPLG